MDTHPHLAPWLASVYVRPDRRGEGVGSRPVRQVVALAAGAGIGKVYLFTPDRKAFYAGLGWTLLEHTIYREREVDVMAWRHDGT